MGISVSRNHLANGTPRIQSDLNRGAEEDALLCKDPGQSASNALDNGVPRHLSSRVSVMPALNRKGLSAADASSDRTDRCAGNQDERPGHDNNPINSEKTFDPIQECHTRRDFSKLRFTLLNWGMIFICGLSTTLSAVFVLLAVKGRRYGSYIGNDPDSKIGTATAILWTSVIATTVELSFVTAFVAFFRQAISRKAFIENPGRGVTLSELTR